LPYAKLSEFWLKPSDLAEIMKLHINGEAQEIAEASNRLTLAQLVEHLSLKADRVAVELNREIAPRDRWSAIQLKEGDSLEIVHFVGGG
jgi:thiamine biosynthesis protein ThiS